VREYLIDLNGNLAGIRAGFNPRSARIRASQLLTNPNIRAAIDRGLAAQATAAGLTQERVLNEIRRIAFSDIGEVFDEDGNLKNLATLSKDTRAALASCKVLRTNLVSGDGVREQVHEVKMWDKLKALEIAAKHLGMLDERVEHDVSIEVKWIGAVDQAINVTPIDRSLGASKDGEPQDVVSSSTNNGQDESSD